MRIKLNDKWYSVKTVVYYNNDKTSIGTTAPEKVEDIEFDSEGECTYKELQRMCADYTCPESDVQEAMNDYDAAVAPLVDRISELEHYRTHNEEIIADLRSDLRHYDAVIDTLSKRLDSEEDLLRQIILALDIRGHITTNEESQQITSSYASEEIKRLQERVKTLEQKPQSTVQETPICEHKIDWEQRRYEIAKHVAGAIYAHSTDIPDVEANYIIELTDNVIKQLKKQ
jgi:chromosome segregation ATPase